MTRVNTAALAALVLFAATPALGATSAWIPPTNVRIVQVNESGAAATTGVVLASGTTTAVFSAINTAISGVAGSGLCTATSHCTVKLMPGTYAIGTNTIVMQPHVDLVGSGRDNTVITSSALSATDGICDVATIRMVNDSSIRELKVVNTATGTLPQEYYAPAVSVVGATTGTTWLTNVLAENVSLVAGTDATVGARTIGICTYGMVEVLVTGSYLEAHGSSNSPRGGMMQGGNLTIRDSRFYLKGGASAWCASVGDNNSTGVLGTLTMANVAAAIDCGNAYGVMGGANTLSLSNSTVAVNANGFVGPLYYSGPARINNVIFSVTGPPSQIDYFIGDPATVWFTNTQLPGGITSLAGANFRNCYGQDFSPIANYPYP